jgi:Cu/Ag efflux pump CusA
MASDNARADFLPAFDEGTVQVNLTLPGGASVEASNEISAIADRVLKRFVKSHENPTGEVLAFARRTGRSEMDEHADPPNESQFFVTINPECAKSRVEILKLLQEAIESELAGVDIEVEQPLAHLISHLISGSTAQIAIKIYGDDLTILEKTANEIKSAIASVKGVSSLVVEQIGLVDEIHIKLKPEALTYYGVSRAYVGTFLQTALQGTTVSQVIEGQRRFDLVVRLDEPYRKDVANLGHLHLELPNGGGHIHLDQLADITPMTGGDAGANQVKRENLRRRIVVRCNAQGRDLASVVRDIETTVKERVVVPEGYFMEYGGQFESQQRATRTDHHPGGRLGGGDVRRAASCCFRRRGSCCKFSTRFPRRSSAGWLATRCVTGQTLYGREPGGVHLPGWHRGAERHSAGDALLSL